MTWRAHITNEAAPPEGGRFAAILGASPSKGARSPQLWNAVFERSGDPARMICLDIPDERALSAVLAGLDSDPAFIGGAATMPYKEAIARWLGPDRLTPEAARIGAVNCLYRGEDGTLMGANTDGEGALASLTGQVGSIDGKRALLIGPGGAGKAVAAFLASAGCAVTIAARRPETAAAFAEAIGAEIIPLPVDARTLTGMDLLVNCTPLGFAQTDPTASPVEPEALSALARDACIFDVIYDPAETPLLGAARALGLRTLNGSEMNLEQAVLGFLKATPSADPSIVRETMAAARAAA